MWHYWSRSWSSVHRTIETTWLDSREYIIHIQRLQNLIFINYKIIINKLMCGRMNKFKISMENDGLRRWPCTLKQTILRFIYFIAFEFPCRKNISHRFCRRINFFFFSLGSKHNMLHPILLVGHSHLSVDMCKEIVGTFNALIKNGKKR